MITKGVDVSGWQGKINWSTMKLAGIDFAYIRLAGVDTKNNNKLFEDQYGKYNIENSMANGILTGPYYYYGNKVDPTVQAVYFANKLVNINYNFPIVIDIEDRKFFPPSLSDLVHKFMIKLEELIPNQRFAIYTSPDYWNAYLKNAQWGDKYYLIVANYKVSAPLIPLPWFPGEQIAWQFTDKGNGLYYGAETKQIDLNVSNLSIEELRGLKWRKQNA